MKNPSIESELRSMAWANEMLLAIVKCVGATEVWAGDCERSQRSLVASQEATKRRIAGGILFAAVGHDERHSRGRIKSRRGTLSKLGDGGGERHPNFSFDAVRPMWRKEIHTNRSHHCGNGCCQQDAEPPA